MSLAPIECFFGGYRDKLKTALSEDHWMPCLSELALHLQECWHNRKQVFLCGNGGSAGNAIHLANDFLYGIAKKTGAGLKIHSLSANPAVITCLANDVGYEHIYSEQLAVLANAGDVLIVLSGSGNSPNILSILKQARKMGVKSYAMLGFSGGESLKLADVAIHFPVQDMQIAEDLQVVMGHMLMQWMHHEYQTAGVDHE